MTRKKLTSTFAVLALLLTAIAPAASAQESQQDQPNEPHTEMVSVDLFYGGFTSDYTLFVGFTLEDACNDVPPLMAPAKVLERGDGTITLKARRIRNIDMFLYEWGGDAFDLIDTTCAAMFDDDPTTQPLQPIATGKGRVQITLAGLDSLDDTGGFHIRNSAWGRLRGEDGSRWRVHGRANFDLHEEGYPIGDPAEFQGLRVKQTRVGH